MIDKDQKHDTQKRDSLAGAGQGSLKLSFQGPHKLGITQPATAVPVLKLYYQRTKIQPAAGHGRSSTKVVLPENKNPTGRRRRPFQY